MRRRAMAMPGFTVATLMPAGAGGDVAVALGGEPGEHVEVALGGEPGEHVAVRLDGGLAAQASDEEVAVWAGAEGQKYSLDVGWSEFCTWRGRLLTPENSLDCEREYLAGIKAAAAGFTGTAPEYYRGLFRSDLYYLAKFGLGYDGLEFFMHYPMARIRAELMLPGSRLLLMAPRSTCKTTLWTIAGSVEDMLIDPNVRVLIRTHSADAAARKLDEARSRMLHSKVLMGAFPEYAQAKRSQRFGVEGWNTPARSKYWTEKTLETAGAVMGQTGSHYDVIYADDMWDESSVRTPKGIETAMTAIAQLDNIQVAGHTRIACICTKWAHNDPSDAVKKDPRFRCVVVSAITPAGKSLFPPLRPGGLGYTLRDLFARHVANDYVFSCQMMLNPHSNRQGFRQEWLQYTSVNEIYKLAAVGKLKLRTVGLFDLASTANERSCYNSLVILLIDQYGRKIIAGAYRRKTTLKPFIDLIFEVADRWHVQLLVRQKAAVEMYAAEDFLAVQDRRRELGLPTYKIYDYRLAGGDIHKSDRIDAMTAPFERLEMYFNSDMDPEKVVDRVYTFGRADVSDIQYLVASLLRWPNLKTDLDMLDALSMISDPVVCLPPAGDKSEAEKAKPDGERIEYKLVQEEREANWRKARAEAAYQAAEGETVAADDGNDYYGVKEYA